MGTLCISEFKDWPLTGAPVAEQSIEFGAKPVWSKSFHHLTKGIRISGDAPCALSLGSAPANPAFHRLAADTDREYQIDGSITSLSVVESGRSGNVTELEALMAYSQAMQAVTKLTDPEWLDGKIAELAAATEAHKAAKVDAEAAQADAAASLTLAKAAQKTADELRASFAPQAEKIAADQAELDASREQLAMVHAALDAKRDALTADQQKLESDRKSIADEVDRQIGSMRDDYTAKMRALGDSVAALKEREAAVAAREAALQAAQDEHAANLAEMQKMAQRLSGVA